MEFLSIPDQAVPFRTVQCQPDHRHQPIIGIVPVEDQESAGRVAPDPFQIQQGILGIGGHFGERFHFFQYPVQFSQFFPAAAGFRCFPVPEALYFGGGTPTALEPHNIKKILDAVRTNLPLAEDCEITFEGRLHGLTDTNQPISVPFVSVCDCLISAVPVFPAAVYKSVSKL